MWKLLAALAAIGAPSALCAQEPAPRPSFDCAFAIQPLETLICSDSSLADLDRALAEGYHAVLATRTGDAEATLRLEQRAWTANRANACGIEGDPAIEAEGAIACLAALYRARIADLQPAGTEAAAAAAPSGYGWLMGEWTIAGIRRASQGGADEAKAQVGRALRFGEAPITTPRGRACSFPRYRAEPAPGPEFGYLGDYPTAVMVRVTCVGIALLDVVRLTDEKILLGEGGSVFELERRR